MSGAGTRIYNILEVLDSGFHRNDKFGIIQRSQSVLYYIDWIPDRVRNDENRKTECGILDDRAVLTYLFCYHVMLIMKFKYNIMGGVVPDI